MPMFRLAALMTLIAAPALADADDERAIAAYLAAFGGACMGNVAENGTLNEPPQRFESTAASSWGEPSPVTVWQFPCNAGAYNLVDVFFMKTEINGILPLPIARPDLQIINENPEDPESPLKEVRIVGWSTTPFLVNPNFDPATGRLTEYSLWRGIGDASSMGVWQIMDESLRLMRYEVDASYDGEMNPETLVDFE